MAMRVSKLLREANISFSAFCAILKSMDMDEPNTDLNWL